MPSPRARAFVAPLALLLLAACTEDPNPPTSGLPGTVVPASAPAQTPFGMPSRGQSNSPLVVEAFIQTREVGRPAQLRDAPYAASNVLMPLHPGDEVRVTGRLPDGSWYRVATNDGEGWVRPTQLTDGSGPIRVSGVEPMTSRTSRPAPLPTVRAVSPTVTPSLAAKPARGGKAVAARRGEPTRVAAKPAKAGGKPVAIKPVTMAKASPKASITKGKVIASKPALAKSPAKPTSTNKLASTKMPAKPVGKKPSPAIATRGGAASAS